MNREEEVAQGCRRGETQAQRQLYETYAPYLMGVCMRYVCDKETALDLLHDGFLLVFTRIGQFTYRGPGSLKAWISQVQRNVILKHLQKQQLFSDSISMDAHPNIVEDEPEPEFVQDIPQEELLRMISQLPVGYRTVFNLFVIEGLSHKEIAQLLGISEKTSSSQFLRARKLLSMKIMSWRKENV